MEKKKMCFTTSTTSVHLRLPAELLMLLIIIFTSTVTLGIKASSGETSSSSSSSDGCKIFNPFSGRILHLQSSMSFDAILEGEGNEAIRVDFCKNFTIASVTINNETSVSNISSVSAAVSGNDVVSPETCPAAIQALPISSEEEANFNIPVASPLTWNWSASPGGPPETKIIINVSVGVNITFEQQQQQQQVGNDTYVISLLLLCPQHNESAAEFQQQCKPRFYDGNNISRRNSRGGNNVTFVTIFAPLHDRTICGAPADLCGSVAPGDECDAEVGCMTVLGFQCASESASLTANVQRWARKQCVPTSHFFSRLGGFETGSPSLKELTQSCRGESSLLRQMGARFACALPTDSSVPRLDFPAFTSAMLRLAGGPPHDGTHSISNNSSTIPTTTTTTTTTTTARDRFADSDCGTTPRMLLGLVLAAAVVHHLFIDAGGSFKILRHEHAHKTVDVIVLILSLFYVASYTAGASQVFGIAVYNDGVSKGGRYESLDGLERTFALWPYSWTSITGRFQNSVRLRFLFADRHGDPSQLVLSNFHAQCSVTDTGAAERDARFLVLAVYVALIVLEIFLAFGEPIVISIVSGSSSSALWMGWRTGASSLVDIAMVWRSRTAPAASAAAAAGTRAAPAINRSTRGSEIVQLGLALTHLAIMLATMFLAGMDFMAVGSCLLRCASVVRNSLESVMLRARGGTSSSNSGDPRGGVYFTTACVSNRFIRHGLVVIVTWSLLLLSVISYSSLERTQQFAKPEDIPAHFAVTSASFVLVVLAAALAKVTRVVLNVGGVVEVQRHSTVAPLVALCRTVMLEEAPPAAADSATIFPCENNPVHCSCIRISDLVGCTSCGASGTTCGRGVCDIDGGLVLHIEHAMLRPGETPEHLVASFKANLAGPAAKLTAAATAGAAGAGTAAAAGASGGEGNGGADSEQRFVVSTGERQEIFFICEILSRNWLFFVKDDDTRRVQQKFLNFALQQQQSSSSSSSSSSISAADGLLAMATLLSSASETEADAIERNGPATMRVKKFLPYFFQQQGETPFFFFSVAEKIAFPRPFIVVRLVAFACATISYSTMGTVLPGGASFAVLAVGASLFIGTLVHVAMLRARLSAAAAGVSRMMALASGLAMLAPSVSYATDRGESMSPGFFDQPQFSFLVQPSILTLSAVVLATSALPGVEPVHLSLEPQFLANRNNKVSSVFEAMKRKFQEGMASPSTGDKKDDGEADDEKNSNNQPEPSSLSRFNLASSANIGM